MRSDFPRRGGGHGGPARHATNPTARRGRDRFTAATALRVPAALQLTMRRLRHFRPPRGWAGCSAAAAALQLAALWRQAPALWLDS